MKFGSVCSGIEAASVAWKPLGWKAAWFSEIEPFPCKVLEHHYPNTPNFGDMNKFQEWPTDEKHSIDLLCGGTPCQSFSVAGLRKGLDDPRGNLMLTFGAIADKYRPDWLVWENVPGVLSSNGGRDFGTFLGMLGKLGYGFAYRVLDAQYFGVAQRRKRVFVVGYAGDWRRAAAVLFERHSLSGHIAPSRKAGERIAPSVTTGPPFSRTGNDRVEAEAMVVGTLLSRDYKGITTDDLTKCVVQPIPLAENTIGRQPENGGNGDGFAVGGPMYTLNATGTHGVVQPITYALDALSSNSMKSANPDSGCNEVEVSKALDTSRGLDPSCNQGGMAVVQPMIVHGTQDPCVSDVAFAQGRNNGGENVMVQSMAVRRLTPVECERLQGFPDNYTDIQSKGKPTPDGPRYKALGNSWAVPVVTWIGKRIQENL